MVILIDQEMELVDDLRGTDDEDAAQNDGGEDAPDEHAVLLGRRDFEEA